MATDLNAASEHDQLLVPTARHARRGVLLVAAALFQFWVWGTRIANLLRDVGDFSTAFVAVHMVLYVTAIGVGVVLAVLGARMWREARQARVDGRTR